MTPPAVPSQRDPAPARKRAMVLAATSLVAATAWLISRVFVGLDFTDEMQYYGEIASLTRTGRLFQVDLFIQQLVYVLVLPFFKLHALLFPDQSYLILAGRLLLLAGYVATGILFWRATAARREFSPAARVAALAAFASWIPFQLFALSYNTVSYLLIVAIVGRWLHRSSAPGFRDALFLASLLVLLSITHPPAGIALLLLVALAAAAQDQWTQVRPILLLAIAGGIIVFALVWIWHGPDFGRSLARALAFSRNLSVAHRMLSPEPFLVWAAVAGGSALFISRMGGGPGGGRIAPVASRPLRFAVLGALPLAAVVLVVLSGDWQRSFLPAVGSMALILIAAVTLRGPSPAGGVIAGPVSPWLARALCFAVPALLLMLGLTWITGYFATLVYLLLLTLLALTSPGGGNRRVGNLVMIATGLGSTFAFASANGFHNFGVGAAAVIPFLVLYAARNLEHVAGGRWPALARQAAMPAVAGLLLFNGWHHPYREDAGWAGFERAGAVAAFKGIWTSPPKIQAIRRFRQLASPGALDGRRLLIVGPQPWLYFALDGIPTTPMFFMHFTAGAAADEWLAGRLFENGEPDVIVVTSAVPPPIHAQLVPWIERGVTGRCVTLPPEFVAVYRVQTWYPLANDVWLFQRAPTAKSPPRDPS